MHIHIRKAQVILICALLLVAVGACASASRAGAPMATSTPRGVGNVTTTSSSSAAPIRSNADAPGGSVVLLNHVSTAGDGARGTVAGPRSQRSLTVSGCRLNNADVAFNSTTGAFLIRIPNSQSTGTCELRFDATSTSGDVTTTTSTLTILDHLDELDYLFLVQKAGPPSGTISGKLVDTRSTVVVSGCGLAARTPVSYDWATGTFSLTIPKAQPAGVCTFTFLINHFSGGVTTSPQRFTVTT